MKNKKGFTLVELVIVIAVIAILAAVLIPVFSGITKKAQVSAILSEHNTYVLNQTANYYVSMSGETIEYPLGYPLCEGKTNWSDGSLSDAAGYSASKEIDLSAGEKLVIVFSSLQTPGWNLALFGDGNAMVGKITSSGVNTQSSPADVKVFDSGAGQTIILIDPSEAVSKVRFAFETEKTVQISFSKR